MPLKIEKLFAFIAAYAEGEGVIAVKTPDGWLPLGGADSARIESLMPLAQQVANKEGAEVVLVEFCERHLIKTISPVKILPAKRGN
jgi:hypothetical protein